MLESDIRKIDFGGNNTLKSNLVNLDKDMDCVIVMSSKDSKLLDLVYHKVIDSIIDRIHYKNVYKDFSSALENINAFLSGWMNDGQKLEGFHALVGIYHKKTFFFSTIGKSSCFLCNTHGDIIEITERDDNPRDFSFISSGNIIGGESLILSTIRLLDTLSKDDIKDGFTDGGVSRAGENIERILLHEHTGKNIGLMILQKEGEKQGKASGIIDIWNQYGLKIFDNRFSRKMLSYVYRMKNSLIHQSQKTRQVLLGLAIVLCTGFLYYVISGFFSVSTAVITPEASKQDLVEAQNFIITASENLNDVDVFTFNIEAAEAIISELESEKLFLNDLTKLRDEVGILQKQFNGISSFETNPQSLVLDFEETKKVVRVLSLGGKSYVIHPNSITGPILQGEAPKESVFTEMFENDEFIDATVYGTDIVLVTQAGKVVNFSKNNVFRYADVKNQATWEKSGIIDSYATNLYLLTDSQNQILRHKRSGGEYDAGVAYLTDDDANSIGKILSLAVDGGIYILKEDGTIVKLFRSPKYRLESMVLNDLPKNYDFKNLDPKNLPEIKTAINLKYVYMLLQNRILVFQPNSLRFQDVKSLKYLGQIEGKDITIEDFYVENDGQIFVAASSGIHKVEFDVVEEKLILK